MKILLKMVLSITFEKCDFFNGHWKYINILEQETSNADAATSKRIKEVCKSIYPNNLELIRTGVE